MNKRRKKILRKEKKGIRYFGFDEVAKEVYGLNPEDGVIHNKQKQQEYQEKFRKNHLCRVCKQPMVYIGGNVLCCKNESCKDKNYILLDEKSKGFARFIYGESEVIL